MLQNAYIPYGCYWSSPFVRWQGSFSGAHAMRLAAEVGRSALEARGVSLDRLTDLHLGMTVPATASFYGAPWMAGLVGAPGITGPSVNQACATSVRLLQGAAFEVEHDSSRTILAIACDRTSNGPHLSYPNPGAPGGRPDSEDWVWDNFGRDPWAGGSMLETAENVAREAGIPREEQDDIVLLRYAQYQDALADDRAFQKRYMWAPVEVKDAAGRRTVATVDGDEGVFETTREGLAKLKPVMRDGSVTFGGQTYPADGNAGVVVTGREQARDLASAPTSVQVLAFGTARAKQGFMAQATVPAARSALERAGLGFEQLDTVKTHNPFAVNDAYFSRETGVALDAMNRFGSSLIYGHPQGPTGLRLVVEMIEELALRGGGTGLMTGCAAGDTAAAVVLRVDS